MRPRPTNIAMRQLLQRPTYPTSRLTNLSQPRTSLRHLHHTTHHSHPTPFQPKIDRFTRFASDAPSTRPRNPLDYITTARLTHRRRATLRKRIVFGVLASGILVALQVYLVRTAPVEHLEAPPGKDVSALANVGAVEVHGKPGVDGVKLDDEGREYVETGTSTIPHFPRFVTLPSSPGAISAPEEEEEEYTLLGLGIRTVSFLSIQVYVLGLYVRTADLPALQAHMVHRISPAGSTLIPDEKARLRAELLDSEKSAEVWEGVLRRAGVKSAVRVVPTRGTDFAHLRDGWVRGIVARTQGTGAEYEDDGFGAAMQEFKGVFGGKGKAAKGSTLYLTRDEGGAMSVFFEAEATKEAKGAAREAKGAATKVPKQEAAKPAREVMGTIRDERISRLVWLGYLGGKNVSSEGARKSVVDGVMDLVERPIGSLGMQVS